MRNIRIAMKREHKEFTSTITRARALLGRLSEGAQNPDKRDLAQLLFFDVAAQWEAFCVASFELELKKSYGVQAKVASRIMTDVDGNRIVSGYSSPDIIAKRAEIMISVNSPWVTFKQRLGVQVYNYLEYGVVVRNFIAHAGVGKGRKAFHSLLDRLSIPKNQRKGLSAGRFLLEYQDSTGMSWFEALPSNYKIVVDYVLARTR